MKKDINIPKVENLYLAIALEYNTTFRTNDWNVYLINEKLEPLELVFIVSKGFDSKKNTSTMRHKIDVLPAKSAAKVEFIQDDVLTLDNEFKVSFFCNNKLFEKTFLIKKNSINESEIYNIETLNKNGVLFK